jgi:hypothetical protein
MIGSTYDSQGKNHRGFFDWFYGVSNKIKNMFISSKKEMPTAWDKLDAELINRKKRKCK